MFSVRIILQKTVTKNCAKSRSYFLNVVAMKINLTEYLLLFFQKQVQMGWVFGDVDRDGSCWFSMGTCIVAPQSSNGGGCVCFHGEVVGYP